MFKLSVEDIVDKVSSSTKLPPDAILGRINKKIEELSGLVSEEGAAHIVANELGVRLLEISGDGTVELKNLLPGLRNIDFEGTVERTFPVHTFKKNDSESKVGSFIVSDGTGEVRVVIWDHRVDLLESGEIREGVKLSVKRAFVKEGKYGIEAHLRSTSGLTLDGGTSSLEGNTSGFAQIKDIVEGQTHIRATVADLSAKNPFFEICPKCGKRLKTECPDHGKVKPAYSMVVELSLFDSTGSIRCVCFGKAAESAIQMEGGKALELAINNKDKFLPIKMAKPDVIGRAVYVTGRAKVNGFTSEMEVVADTLNYPGPDEEISRLRSR